MDTSLIIERFLYGRLAGDATLMGLVNNQIYGSIVPTRDLPPMYVLYSPYMLRDDVTGLDGTIIAGDGRYIVRVVGEVTSYADLEPVAQRIHTLIHQAPPTVVAGGRVDGCVRLRPFQLVELFSGREFRHLGGIYRVMVSP